MLMPRTPNEAPGTNLPPELAARYTLCAPEHFVLPPLVIGFLKAHPACYLECTQTALLYCEFNTVSVAQLQPLRFRAQQLLKELVKKAELTQPAQTAPTPTAQLTDAELQAQLLLKLQSAPRNLSHASAGNGGRYVYAVILLGLLGGMLLLAWVALHHWVAR